MTSSLQANVSIPHSWAGLAELLVIHTVRISPPGGHTSAVPSENLDYTLCWPHSGQLPTMRSCAAKRASNPDKPMRGIVLPWSQTKIVIYDSLAPSLKLEALGFWPIGCCTFFGYRVLSMGPNAGDATAYGLLKCLAYGFGVHNGFVFVFPTVTGFTQTSLFRLIPVSWCGMTG